MAKYWHLAIALGAGWATMGVIQLPAAELKTTTSATATQPAASSRPPVSQRIDQLLVDEVGLNEAGIKDQLAPQTSDQTFLRRAYLDLVGELPPPTEIVLFSLDPAADKRAKLVERLLADPRYGRNWSRYWRDVIYYRRADDRALISAQAVESFLADQFNQNVGWDKIAQAFIAAKGDVYENGATAVIMAQQAEPNNVASEVSRIFMGTQISCAQCHNHPFDDWKREQFHEFAAFFPRVSLMRRPQVNNGPPGFEVGSVDGQQRMFGQLPTGRGSLEHYMPDLKDPASKGTLMAPAFFATGDQLATGATDAERRSQLAQWLTSPRNPWFAKAVVNRVWGELVGEGFYEPLDDLGEKRPCAAPNTLSYLAAQFVEHNHDLKWLYQTVMSTDAYQRESRPRRNANQKPFLANCSYRLRSDIVYDALWQAAGVPQPTGPGGAGAGFARFFGGPRAQFAMTFGYDPSERRENIAGSIPQALALMNSQQFLAMFRTTDSRSPLGQIIAETRDDEQLIVDLYLRFLAREPSDAELKLCRDHVRSAVSRNDAYDDLVWTLLNRTEFLYRN